jgi:hypothetical protein
MNTPRHTPLPVTLLLALWLVLIVGLSLIRGQAMIP